MHRRLICAFTLLVALPACGEQAVNEETSPNAKAAPAAPSEAVSRDDRAALAQELSLTAQMLSKQLPLRQQGPQGMVTISGIEANGTEFIHRVEVPNDLDAGSFEQFRAQLPARLCEDSTVRQAVMRGATYTYVMRDKDGETFSASVESC